MQLQTPRTPVCTIHIHNLFYAEYALRTLCISSGSIITIQESRGMRISIYMYTRKCPGLTCIHRKSCKHVIIKYLLILYLQRNTL